MANYAVETRSTSPKNFFAGDFPTLTESGTAGEVVKQFAPVAINASGKVVNITSGTKADVIGIAAVEAKANEPVVYYMTGEFFADALEMPDGVTAADISGYLRKLSIFLRGSLGEATPVVTPSVELSDSTASIVAEATKQLTATTIPADAEVTWTSSDDTKATVSDSGLVTGVAAGSATITAKITVDGTDYSDTCAVTVTAE